MNHSKIYSDLINGVEEEKQDANNLRDSLLVGDHASWLENPVTKRFLSALETCLVDKLNSAMEGSVGGVSDDTLRKQLIQTETIKKITKYASSEITTTRTFSC